MLYNSCTCSVGRCASNCLSRLRQSNLLPQSTVARPCACGSLSSGCSRSNARPAPRRRPTPPRTSRRAGATPSTARRRGRRASACARRPARGAAAAASKVSSGTRTRAALPVNASRGPTRGRLWRRRTRTSRRRPTRSLTTSPASASVFINSRRPRERCWLLFVALVWHCRGRGAPVLLLRVPPPPPRRPRRPSGEGGTRLSPPRLRLPRHRPGRASDARRVAPARPCRPRPRRPSQPRPRRTKARRTRRPIAKADARAAMEARLNARRGRGPFVSRRPRPRPCPRPRLSRPRPRRPVSMPELGRRPAGMAAAHTQVPRRLDRALSTEPLTNAHGRAPRARGGRAEGRRPSARAGGAVCSGPAAAS